ATALECDRPRGSVPRSGGVLGPAPSTPPCPPFARGGMMPARGWGRSPGGRPTATCPCPAYSATLKRACDPAPRLPPDCPIADPHPKPCVTESGLAPRLAARIDPPKDAGYKTARREPRPPVQLL